MKALLLIVAAVLSLVPVLASAQTTDLTNFHSSCVKQADGTSVVSGSFDLATGEIAQVQERGYNFQTYRGRNYSKITYFGPAWTITANADATNHYTFTFPAVSAYLTYWKMQQGAILYVDAASFLDYRWSPAIPITLTFGTGACV